MTKHFFNILSAIVLVLAFSACQDDTFSSFEQQEGIKEGETVVSATISFKPLAEGLTSRTAGNAIKAITDLNILAYDEEGNLVKVQHYTSGTNSTTTYTLSDANRTDADAENNKTAESSTPHAELKLALPYGKYIIYAVANMGDIATDHAEAIKTINGLKAISLTWNADDVAANCQMFGYFTGSGSETESEPTVTINRDDISLHAWIRRAASKVTVAYDGSELKDNIYIYIHSAQIKDIPTQCYLANENTVGADDYTLSNTLIADGETIDYTKGSKENAAGITITKGNPKGGSDHSETADALFFYENMQGTDTQKHQYKNFESKDNKPYGSYIEVKGYYVNRTADNSSQGPIIYRFMLGKNVTDDFNAERNYHYKLTLRFINNANDPDWHIVYEPESPEITIPDPLYISYVPNESVNVPVVVRGATSSTTVKADIIESHWYGDKGHKYDYTFPNVGILSLAKTENGTATTSVSGVTPSKVLTDRCLYSIPVYTRGLSLGSSFSGYNYFPHDTRTGTVRFSVTINGTTYTKDVRIVQVKRVVNPAGVWREASSTKAFNFRLMELNEDDDSETGPVHRDFHPTISDGPWTAHIEQGSDWVEISPTGSGNWGTSDVTGGTASEVRFDVRPGSTCGDGTVRHGVIKVTYNNNTCIHYFFVSQGLGDVPMSVNITYPTTTVYNETSTKHTCHWMNRNMKYAGVPCENPLMEGGKFRWGNSYQALKPEDDFRDGYGFNKICYSTITPSGVETVNAKSHWLYDGSSVVFTAIWHPERPTGFRYDEHATYKGRFYSDRWPAKYADWTALQSHPRYYGVLYGEESTETATNTTDAYTYINPGDVKGMQGLFVWDRTNARHIFFPIGAKGHGHRKASDLYQTIDGYNYDGHIDRDVLKYAQRPTYMKQGKAETVPMLYDLWMRKGAIYWYEENEFYTINKECFAHDINYYTYDLNTYGANPVTMAAKGATDPHTNVACRSAQWADACYVRCVHY